MISMQYELKICYIYISVYYYTYDYHNIISHDTILYKNHAVHKWQGQNDK